jgi:entericidin B
MPFLRQHSDSARPETHVSSINAMEMDVMTTTIRLDRNSLRAALTGLLLAGAVMSLSACNTVKGAGQDISNTGTATSNTAAAVQQKL